MARLSPLRLTTSHTYLYKKLDEFGKHHDKDIIDAVDLQSQYLEKKKSIPESITRADHPLPSNIDQDGGRKLTFDNVDYRQEVHYMTEEHQNVDKHCVTVMATENRVLGKHLSDNPPDDGVLKMDHGECLPSNLDNVRQRENYIVLAGQIITSNIPCLNFLSDACTKYIPHQYKKEMSLKSKTVSVCKPNLSVQPV